MYGIGNVVAGTQRDFAPIVIKLIIDAKGDGVAVNDTAELGINVTQEVMVVACLQLSSALVLVELDTAHEAHTSNEAFHRFQINSTNVG